MNRARWSGVDLKKAEIALSRFDPAKMSVDKYVEQIKDDFPTRSVAAIKRKFVDLAAELGLDLTSPSARARTVANLDSRWTKDELSLLDDLVKEYDPTKKSASEFGRDIADFFKDRHSEMAVCQRVALMTRPARAQAAAEGLLPGVGRSFTPPPEEPPEDPPAPPEQPASTPAAVPAPESPRFRDPGLDRTELYDAFVTGTADYGVFVRVDVHGVPVEGLVHVGEVSDSGFYVNPRDEFHIGEDVEVGWLETNPKGHAFSLRRAGYVLKSQRRKAASPTPIEPPPAPSPPSPAPAPAQAAPLPPVPPASALPAPPGGATQARIDWQQRPYEPAPPMQRSPSGMIINPRAIISPPQPRIAPTNYVAVSPILKPEATTTSTPIAPTGSVIDQLTHHLIKATSLTQELINNQNQPASLTLAWAAINEALEALSAMELKKGITILENYRNTHMKGK